jgi:transcriptional regulator with GAF, ATPase, and Fis domain
VVRQDRPGLAELERRAIRDALDRCRGRIYGPDGAAAALGLKPTTLYGRMRKHGIPKHPIPGDSPNGPAAGPTLGDAPASF